METLAQDRMTRHAYVLVAMKLNASELVNPLFIINDWIKYEGRDVVP